MASKARSYRWTRPLLLPMWVMLFACFAGVLAPWLSGRHWGWTQVWAGFVPFFLPFWLVSMAWWWKRRRTGSWIALLGVLFSGLVFTKDYRFPFAGAPEDQPDLTVMSMNVQYFDYSLEVIDSIGALIRRYDPDVVCLQEFRNRKMHPDTSTVAYFSQASGLPYGQFANLPVHMHGVAIFSKYPILDVDTLYTLPDQTNSGMSVVLDTPFGQASFASIHLSSFQVDRVMQNQRITLSQRISYLYDRFQRISARQTQQAELIVEKLQPARRPTIVCGDFNATAHTRILRPFFANFQDSFQEAGKGLGHTYPLRFGYGLRIDYQLSSAHWHVLSHEVIRSRLSDHYPVIATYRLISR